MEVEISSQSGVCVGGTWRMEHVVVYLARMHGVGAWWFGVLCSWGRAVHWLAQAMT